MISLARRGARVLLYASVGAVFVATDACSLAEQPQPFTLRQVLSAPYCTSLTPSPAGERFAWVEDAEGRHNLWVASAGGPSRQLTHNTADDGQDISQLAWSPDGNQIAFVSGAETGADGQPANPAHLQRPTPVQVWTVSLSSGSVPRLLGDGHAPLFSRDGHAVFYIRAGQTWSAPPHSVSGPGNGETGAAQLVYDRGSAHELTLSPDGTRLAFISRRGRGADEHSFLALFDLRTRTLSFPAPSSGDDSAPAFSPDGRKLAWLRAPFVQAPEFAADRASANPWSIEVLDQSTGNTRAIFAPPAGKPGSVMPHMALGEPYVFWAAPAEGARSPRLLFFSEADGWVHLYALTPARPDTAPQLLTPGPFEVEDASLSRDRRTLLYASNQASADPLNVDRRHLWRLDLSRPGAEPIEVTQGSGIETHPELAADGQLLAALVADPRIPMHPALIGTDGRITPLHPGALPAEYPAAALVVPQQVLFASADGLFLLHGQLFLPAQTAASSALQGGNSRATEKHPAILFFHGGPHRQMLLGYPPMEYYSNAYAMNQYLASRGFIVLSVNYRCGIGYGLDFRQCIHAGADGASEYNDVLGAAAYLRSRPHVDASRIGIWGGSYGGYLTALALARNSNLFAAGVDFHGVHDWILEDNRADWLRGTAAEQAAIAARAHASSPMAAIDRWHSPVLLIHGDNDANVAYRQTPILADALRARGVYVEELIFPDEVHEFLLHRDWLESYRRAAAFLERTLDGHEEETFSSGTGTELH